MTVKQQRILNTLYKTPIEIGHLLGWKDLTDIHNDWIKKFLKSPDDMTLLAHRGSYKTTCLSIAVAILMVTKPELLIIILRKTDSDVTEFIEQVSQILKSDLFLHIIKELYNIDLELTVDNQSEINTNLTTGIKGASQLRGFGLKPISGKHGDLIITDDIVNLKDRVSKAERDNTKICYMELQNIKNRGGRFINTGTKWHKDDCIEIMPNIEIHDCYTTGLINSKQLQTLRDSMTSSLFSANYELKHIASEDVIFSNPKYFKDITLIHNGICHIDASYGGKDGTAFGIGRKVPKHVVTIEKDGVEVKETIPDKYYLFGKRWNKHVDDCLEDIVTLIKEHLGGTVYCESNADKGYLAKELRKHGVNVITYHESTNKFVKISTYLKTEWKNIEFSEDTDLDYINEILDFNEQAEHDDAPDNASCLIRKLYGKKSSNEKASLWR